VKKVKGHPGYPNGPGGKSFQYSSDKRGSEVRPNAWAGHSDADGLETIPAWQCSIECCVLAMDRQSGVLTSGTGAVKRKSSKGHQTPSIGTESRPEGTLMLSYGDSGGASRFFPQFGNDAELDTWLTHLLVGKHLV
jgi:hypothetical protein